MPAKTNLSGASWWKLHQGKYPNSRDLASLDPGFRSDVARFIDVLRDGGASISIGSTLRHPSRAHLMHYAWKVAHGLIEPDRVPARAGVLIDWDHGDVKASRAAALEMVQAAHMAHIASLTSNHTRGTAIDMTISWKGTLMLKLPGSFNLWEIKDPPRNGSKNTELHRLGESLFGVKKLKSDPPHWSHNGR